MRTRLSIIVWSAVALAACVPPRPPKPPVPPAPATRALAVVVVDARTGSALSGASVAIAGARCTADPCLSNGDGYVLFDGLTVGGPVAASIDLAGYRHGAAEVPALAADTPDLRVALERDRPPLQPAGRDPLRMNFGSARDDDGTPIFTPFLAALWQDGDLGRAERWLRKLADEGTTVLLVQLESKPYPGYPIRGFDFRNDLTTFARYLEWLQGHPAGDGFAWRFFVQLTSGDDDRRGEYVAVPRYVDALQAFKPYVARWCMGFETFGAWPTSVVYRWVETMRAALGDDAVIEGWGLPNRATAASYHGDGSAASCSGQGFGFVDYRDANRPGTGGCIDIDDPSRGDEAGAMIDLARMGLDAFGFQFEHGRAVTEPCGRSIDDGSGRGFKYPADCAMGRFDDVVARLGAGLCTDDYGHGNPCGWPRLIVDAIETDEYDAFHGASNPAIAERIANDALAVCQVYGVPCGFGSGLPTSWRPPAPSFIRSPFTEEKR